MKVAPNQVVKLKNGSVQVNIEDNTRFIDYLLAEKERLGAEIENVKSALQTRINNSILRSRHEQEIDTTKNNVYRPNKEEGKAEFYINWLKKGKTQQALKVLIQLAISELPNPEEGCTKLGIENECYRRLGEHKYSCNFEQEFNLAYYSLLCGMVIKEEKGLVTM